MDVLFLSPAYPPEMVQFTRGLVEVGARVWGVAEAPLEALPEGVRGRLSGHLQVPRLFDTDDVERRVLAWLDGRRPDRIESNWEPLTLLAARLRERLGIAGMSVETVRGFRDKPEMRARVAAAGLRIPRTARVRSADEARAFAADSGFPLVLKPVAGAGSADTFRVDSPAALDATLARLGHLEEASCEEFVVGDELTYETLCVDGEPVYESVSFYLPNCLDARKNEWISPIIVCARDLQDARFAAGVRLGPAAIAALGMGTGFTHMEWFRRPDGEAVFGEIACRPPGANMVDLMNYAGDVDLFREWARVVCWHDCRASSVKPWNAAIVFKRARGSGHIVGVEGLEAFRAAYGPWIAREDLLPPGAARRDWTQTFLSDGNVVVRHPDLDTCRHMAEQFARDVHLHAR